MVVGEPGARGRSELETLLEHHVARWPGNGAAAVVLPGGGHVLAGDPHRVFAWASVTKLMTCLAALIAVEEGVVGLDDAAGPPGATLRHLMAHASGLPFDGRTPVSRPGRRRIYSNTGIEMVAEHIARRSGMPFADYLSEGVAQNLEMRSFSVSGSPASGGRGDISDLASLATEMMGPSLVSAAAWSEATTVAFPGLVGVVPGFGRQDPCDWGLGPEIRGHKSPHWTGKLSTPATFGHFGMSGSFVWVDPELGLALCGLCSTDFEQWAKQSWPDLSDDVVRWARGEP
ncbi:MAG TPA: serine hydrolase domain-containing protein [Acidimicrobiales bacterium]|nr:serine hydrolase domain-containing protein [Acidimicrobiales bacterium]